MLTSISIRTSWSCFIIDVLSERNPQTEAMELHLASSELQLGFFLAMQTTEVFNTKQGLAGCFVVSGERLL